MLVYILAILVSGLVVGALGRLAIPGPNPMGLGTTVAVGVAGSALGGLVGHLLFRRMGGITFAVLGAALIVWLLDRGRPGGRRPHH